MRILLGLLILGSLFLLAATWQDRIVDGYHQERRLRHGVADAQDRHGGAWARLVLGRPSGEQALPAPVELTPAALPGGAPDAAPVPTPLLPPDYRYVVNSGDVLGRICQVHYESERPLVQLVEAVAAYNDLRANRIREGQTLLLPDLGVLFPGE